MRRWTALAGAVSLLVGTFITATADAQGPVFDLEGITVSSSGPLHINAVPWGPTESAVQQQKAAVLGNPGVKRLLAGSRHRMLSFEILDDDADSAVAGRYRASIYDYTSDRHVVVEGEFGRVTPSSIAVVSSQPLPSSAEFEEAVSYVERDPLLGTMIADGRLVPYRPMPPIISNPNGTGRVLTVGLRPTNLETTLHEIVGVVMKLGTVLRFASGAPPASAATQDLCGARDAGYQTGDRDELRHVLITITQNNEVLWRFVVVRPSSSSGTNGSGVELRHVEYRGRRVLERAHAPILNVKYEEGSCGPYRDWLWEEGMFDATGREVSGGFVECNKPPKTIAESGSDAGSFRGVAVHTNGDDITLVSELDAGWYRYTSEWRLTAGGAIRPRFHFAAVQDSCTCLLHNHHVFWRFDFAVNGQSGDSMKVRDLAVADSPWEVIDTERRFFREPSKDLTWRVGDQSLAYEIQPGFADGTAMGDNFAAGDVWVLRGRSSEIDDGQEFTTEASLARANLDVFVDGEDVSDEDVVMWYGAHVRHGSQDAPSYDIGPAIVPVTWQ